MYKSTLLPRAIKHARILQIEHCIEEWADGTHKAQNLNDTTQSSRYLAHMSDIKAWCKEDERVTTNIRKLWVAKGR